MPPSRKTHNTFCHVLSIEPLVIFGLGNLGPFSPARQLCEPLKNIPVYFILGPSWDLDDATEFYTTVQHYREHTLAYPQHNFIFMVNAEHHAEKLQRYGVQAFFCHHNALIDERIYKIIPTEKKYDAIYNARIDPFKRHGLARDIRSLALIYYFLSKEGNLKYLKYRNYVAKILANAAFLNEATGRYLFLSPEEICRHLNSAHVGLVLSKVEGGNHASVEYLLSGIPVVSTKNTGGRNHFLLPEFSRIVDPYPNKVREAVEELKALRISPQTIRRKTLIRCLAHRRNFQAVVQNIFDYEGARRNFADEWDTVYLNKLFNWDIPDWQVVDYVKKWRGRTDKVEEPLRRSRSLAA